MSDRDELVAVLDGMTLWGGRVMPDWWATQIVDALLPVVQRIEAPRRRPGAVITPATIPRVPNQPKTPLKSFRIPEALYAAAQAKAAERGETVSEVVRKALERYVRRR